MSQKEAVETSEMKPPLTSVMPPARPSAAPARTPWMSHVVRGRSPMLSVPPFFHMIHVPSPLAIVNTRPMFMSPPPEMYHQSGDGTANCCAVPGCPARAALPTRRASEDSTDAMKTSAASCSASGTSTHDLAFLNFQKNAQLHGIKMKEETSMNPKLPDDALLKFQKNAQSHGIKISSTTEKLEHSGSDVVAQLSVASPVFTPRGDVSSGSGKTFALPESLRPDVIVFSSSDDDEDDVNWKDAVTSSKAEENLQLQIMKEIQTMDELQTIDDLQTIGELQTLGGLQMNVELQTMGGLQTMGELKTISELQLQTMRVPLTVDGADNCANYSEGFLSSELQDVEGQVLSQFVSDMQRNSEAVFCIGAEAMCCPLCSKRQEMVSSYTQTDFMVIENVNSQMIDECTSTEDLKIPYHRETSPALAAAAIAVAAASITERDDLKQSQSANEISDVSVNVSECHRLKVPSLDTIDDSTSDEEMDLPRDGKLPEIAAKSETNSLTSEAVLVLVKQEHSDDLMHPLASLSVITGKQDGKNIAGISKANSFTSSNTSSSIVPEEPSDSCLSLILEQNNAVSGELERWEGAERSKTNGMTSSTSSSIATRKEYHDGICHLPSDLRDECRRRNVAAVEAVCEMFETDKIAGDADIETDSVAKVDNYLSAMTELNIKCPEVGLSRGSEDYLRMLETVPVSAFCEDQALGGGASSTTRLTRPPGFEERNDLSNVVSRSGRSSIDNCSVDDIRRQPKGPSSSQSSASARQHKNCHTTSRNICLDEAAGASVQETICMSKIASIRGRDNLSHSESGELPKAYNARMENLDVRMSFTNSLLEDDCRRNVMTSADDESLSGSENMSVAMSVSGAELKSDRSAMPNSLSQLGLKVPTELMDMIKSQLLLCDSALASNPQMLEMLAVQQLYLMHQEHMLASQMMETLRQYQQPQQMLLPQHAAQQALTPQQLLLQQQLVAQQLAQQQLAQQQLAQQQLALPHLLPTQQLVTQQQLAHSHLLPTQQFVNLPPTSQSQNTLPPRFAARLPSQGQSCTETPTNVHSSIPENSLFATFASSNAFHKGTLAEGSQPQMRSSQDMDFNNQSHVELRTAKNQEPVVKAMDYKQQGKSSNSVTQYAQNINDNTSSRTASAGTGLSAALPASQGKRASSVSSKASAAFHPDGERSESTVTSSAMSSRSAAGAQHLDSSVSAARSGNGKPSGLSDRKVTDVCGDKKLLFKSIGVDKELTSTVPVSSVTKPSYSKILGSERIGLPVSETAESKPSDNSFSARGRGSSIGGGGGVRPKSVAKVDNIQNGASADGFPGNFGSRKQSQDSVNFNTREYGQEKLPEFKRPTECPRTRGSVMDKFAMGEDCTRNQKLGVQEATGGHNRRMEGPFRRTTSNPHRQSTDEDWGEAGSATWIKDPVHYGPPKCTSSRVKPKGSEEW